MLLLYIIIHNYNLLTIIKKKKIIVCITLPRRRGSRPDGARYKMHQCIHSSVQKCTDAMLALADYIASACILMQNRN